MAKQKKRMVRFYCVLENGTRMNLTSRECVYPKRTNDWRRLERIINRKDVKLIGYENC